MTSLSAGQSGRGSQLKVGTLEGCDWPGGAEGWRSGRGLAEAPLISLHPTFLTRVLNDLVSVRSGRERR